VRLTGVPLPGSPTLRRSSISETRVQTFDADALEALCEVLVR